MGGSFLLSPGSIGTGDPYRRDATTTEDASQDGSRFFNLPWEVRERIHEYYLAFANDNFGDTLRPLHFYLEQGGYSRPLPPLMLTCRRAYRELAPRVHSDAAMRVHTAGRGDRRLGFAVHGNLRFERLRRLHVLVATEYPHWNRWLGTFAEVARRAGGGLREVVVDWGPRPEAPRAEGGKGTWEEKLAQKKQDEFFAILGGMEGLEVVRFHGAMPAGWRERFKSEIKSRLFTYPYRWWREPGME
ncbi:hypothetical protein CMUS01_12310 [Colletotrichum musicola]|uniref:Uncharacterized protein n=1 Tax=Colletotrichum musicola TaxID=2175873 RepID=A0A8H6N1K1_9PEZI|nr:hypothetical protein CMUS01_12310 [Colletotrichum musicola]